MHVIRSDIWHRMTTIIAPCDPWPHPQPNANSKYPKERHKSTQAEDPQTPYEYQSFTPLKQNHPHYGIPPREIFNYTQTTQNIH